MRGARDPANRGGLGEGPRTLFGAPGKRVGCIAVSPNLKVNTLIRTASNATNGDQSQKLATEAVRWNGQWWRWSGRWVPLHWAESNSQPARFKPLGKPLVGAKQRLDLVENPVTDQCFEHTADLRLSICPGPYLVDRRVARDMKMVMDDESVADCCFQLAVLQQLKTEKEVAVMRQLKWGPADNGIMVAQARKLTHDTARTVIVKEISPQGVEEIFRIDGDRKNAPIEVLVAHVGFIAGAWRRHAMPLRRAPSDQLLKKYGALAQECQDTLAREAIESIVKQMAEENAFIAAEQVATVPADQAPVAKGRSIETQTCDDQEWEVQVEELFCPMDKVNCVMTNSRCKGERIESAERLNNILFGRQILIDGYPEEMAWHITEENASDFRPFTPFRRAPGGSAILSKLSCRWGVPDIALATIENVRNYGQRTIYWFACAPGRAVVDGTPDYILSEHDQVEVNGVRWRFVKKTVQCRKVTARCYELEIVQSTAGNMSWGEALLRDTIPVCLRAPFAGAVVVEIAGKMPKEIENNVFWRLEHSAETDPAVAANLAVARNKAAAGADLPAKKVAREVRYASRAYRGTLVGFGGSFGWGYCYSCGAAEKGKYNMRLCKKCDNGIMSTLGRAVSEAEEVATLANPVLYPGFVERAKQHPPLKDDAATTQVDENGQPRLGGKVRVFDARKRAMTYQMVQGLVNPGKGPWLAGIGINGAGPFITAAGTQPLVEAILFRVFKKLEDRKINEQAFKRASALAESPFLLQSFLQSSPTVLKILDYIMSNPSARRRRQLLEAWRKWDDRGEHSKDWDEINAFVKQENLPWFSPKQGELNPKMKKYIARLIQAPHDETHLVAGRYLKPLMSELKNCWHSGNWIFYGSTSPEKLTDWLRGLRASESYFWSDYTAFDATFSPHTWEMIEGFYRRIYPDAEQDFWKVMDIWRKPKGRMLVRKDNTRVEYDAEVCNCSGRDDTALANALFNGIALAMSFAAVLAKKNIEELTELDLERASHLCKISVVGDDSLVGCSFDVEPLKDEIVKRLKEFGLVVKAEASRRLEDVTYLGMMPYEFADGDVAWGPTIGRRLYKMFWMTEKSAPAAWARGVSEQAKLLKHVPIVHEMALKVDELLKGKSVTKSKADGNRPWHFFEKEQKPWDWMTVQGLCSRYPGLTKEMIYKDIRTIRSIDRLPAVVELQSVKIILQTDDL